LHERIADLHCRTLLVQRVIELCRRHRGAVDTIPARLRTDVVHGVANTRRRALDDLVGFRNAQTEHIDEWIAGIALVEPDLTADRWDADRVSVPADARYDA